MGITSATPHKPSGPRATRPRTRSDLPQGTGRQRAATAGHRRAARAHPAGGRAARSPPRATPTPRWRRSCARSTSPSPSSTTTSATSRRSSRRSRGGPRSTASPRMDFAAGDLRRAVEKVQGRHRAADPRDRGAPPLRLLRLQGAAGLPAGVHRGAEEAGPSLLRPAVPAARAGAAATATSTSAETKITALRGAAACPASSTAGTGPGGRLSPDEVVAELTKLASRVIGLRRRTDDDNHPGDKP